MEKFDKAYLEMATVWARNSYCKRRQVGALIVKDRMIISDGYNGTPSGFENVCEDENGVTKPYVLHAEANAITKVAKSGNSSEGATLYVTASPCVECAKLIIQAGIKRVVYGSVDPNPVNRGRAKRILSRAGIVCECADDGACDDLITPFTKHVRTGLPYVTVKLAMSLDGRICDDFGNARWISSAKSRKMTGKCRERVDAIMVGAETIRKDNPSLLSHGKRNDDLIRVVVTRSGTLPKNAQVFTDGAPNTTKVFRVGKDAKDLKDVLRQLGRMGVMHVLCEGGLKLARSLADAGLVDEWITVLAPVVIGSRPIARALRGVMEIMDDDCGCSYVQDAFTFVNFKQKYFKE